MSSHFSEQRVLSPECEPWSDSSGARAGRFWRGLLIVLVTRIMIGAVLFLWESLSPTPPTFDAFYHDVKPLTSRASALFVRWDSYWYLNIVEQGYWISEDEAVEANVAFAPLYPGAMWLISRLGVAPWVAGVVVSVSCFVLMLWLLFELGCVIRGPRLGVQLMVLHSVHPGAWILNMVYSESMFCACLAGFFLFYRQRRYAGVAVCAALLPLIRVAGLVIVPTLIMAQLFSGLRSRSWRRELLPIVGALSGLAVLMLWAWVAVGDATAYFSAGDAWFDYSGSGAVLPLVAGTTEQLSKSSVAWLLMAMWIAYLLASVMLLREDYKSAWGWFGILNMAMLLKTPFIYAQPRYLLPMIPVHVWFLKRVHKPATQWRLLFISLLCQLLFFRLVLNWKFAP